MSNMIPNGAERTLVMSGAWANITRIEEFISNHPVASRAPWKAWARILRWQIECRVQEEVIVPWIGQLRLVVRKGMTGATGNIYAGLHEFADMALLIHFLRPDDIFLDIGSNIGTFSVLASGHCGARSIAFEPDPDTARFLIKNLVINGLEERVTVERVALGSEDANVLFTVGMDTVNRVVGADAPFNMRQVQQRRLDSIRVGNPIMIKIDVEGHESSVISGAEETLQDKSLQIVEMETISSEIVGKMLDYGFSRVYYDPFTRRLTSEIGKVASSNAIFVKDHDFVQVRLEEAPRMTVLGVEF